MSIKKEFALVCCLAIALVAGVAFVRCQTTPAPMPAAGIKNPKANGLERGEAARRAMALSMQQSHLKSDQKQLTHAAAEVSSASSTPTTIQNGKAIPYKATLASRLTMAQKRVTQDTKAIATAQTRVNDWNASTLKAHGGDPTKHQIDWTHGLITAK